LHLHDVPSDVVHKIPEIMPQLKTFWCENIFFNDRDRYIDFGKFRNVSKLTELCIHSSEAFQLPAFIFQGSISRLGDLLLLKTLVISNIEGNLLNLNEFVFLRRLTNLQSLTLGFCYDWSQEVYESVGSLKKLKYLSLNGISCKIEELALDSALINCLNNLPELQELELIDFYIPEGLAMNVGKLRNLKSLRLIDSSITQNGQRKPVEAQLLNYVHTIEFLKNLTFLKTLTWHADNALIYINKLQERNIPNNNENNINGSSNDCLILNQEEKENMDPEEQNCYHYWRENIYQIFPNIFCSLSEY